MAESKSDFVCNMKAQTIEEARNRRCPASPNCNRCTNCCGGDSFENCTDRTICPQICSTFQKKSYVQNVPEGEPCRKVSFDI